MTLHKEGTSTIIIACLVFLVLNIVGNRLLPMPLSTLLFIFSLVLLVLVFYFFRNPGIKPNLDANGILCPCDGKVVVIEEVEEPEFFKDQRIQVSIFMSPLNVHINWYPISGKVLYAVHHAGKFMRAWLPKASSENERSTVVIEREDGQKILMRQIAGAVARRIVTYAQEGETVEQGGEEGFIKFGSRVDVFLPLGSNIEVSLNEIVKGNQTIIATL